MKTFLSLASLLVTAKCVPWRAPADPFSPSHWPLPHNVTGDNEPGDWGGIYVHDPSVIKGPDGHYYSFSTHDLVAISRAPTLDGYWSHAGSVLHGASIINLPGNNDTWAPDVHKVGNTYYCYYSVSTFGSQISAIGLATSKTLQAGSWTDHGLVIESGPTEPSVLAISNAIDGNFFLDPETHEPLLNYGSFYGDIFQFHLAKNLSSVVYDPAPVQISIDPAGTRPEEGSYMSYRAPYYYLWFSHGICCGFNASDLPPAGQEYSIRVGRSKSAQGPFVDRNGTSLLDGGGSIVYGSNNYVYAPGGQGVLSDYFGRDVLYYHYGEFFSTHQWVANANMLAVTTYGGYTDNTLLGWDYLEYIDDWPVLVY